MLRFLEDAGAVKAAFLSDEVRKIELDALFEFISKLEVVTDRLVPRATNLIPWIENGEVALFSQPSRAKRSSNVAAGG